jgi:hypothetical protein
VIELFLAAQTQWRVGMSGPTGLDYAGVEACARLRGATLDPDTFEALQTAELAALGAWRDKRARER